MSNLVERLFKKIFGLSNVNYFPVDRLPTGCDNKLDLLDIDTVKDVGFLNSINSKECHFSSNANRLRKKVLFPVAVGFVFGFFFFINNFVKEWKGNETALIEFVVNAKKEYSDNVF